MKLLVYPPAFGELNGSPFCVKALALLQMSGLDFETEIIDDPRKQPKGKLPVLHDEGTVIPDSSLIRVHLEQKYGLDFDAGLDPRQKAESHAIVRMLEEGLYFLIVASRWQEDRMWPTLKAQFFKDAPFLVSAILAPIIRRGTVKQVIAQGAGRFTPEERLGLAERDVIAVEDLLGGKPYLFGPTPTAADATAVAMLRALAFFPLDNPMSDLVLRRKKLVDYVARGKDAMFPPLEILQRAA